MTESLWLGGALGAFLAVFALIVWPEWPIWRRMAFIVVAILLFNIALALMVDKLVEALPA